MSLAGKLLRIISGGKSPRPSLDTMLEIFDNKLENFHHLSQPSPISKPRTPFDSPHLPVEKLSVANMSRKQFLTVLPIMLSLLLRMRRSSKFYDGMFQPTRSEATPEFIEILETMARAAGVKDIKYVKVPHNAIFQSKGIPHEYAIVFTVEMDHANISTAPSYEAFREVAKGYKNLAVIGNKLSKTMRKNGHAAYPGTALGGITDYTYLSELAGLGAIGYHGLLITPGEGARLRINTIYTNITNLPIQSENEHLWVRDFCAMCKKCIRACPVKAIYDQPVPRGDGGMQCIEHAACRDYFNQNFGCAICLARCPFSTAGYEIIKSRFVGNLEAPQFRIQVESFSAGEQTIPVEIPLTSAQ